MIRDYVSRAILAASLLMSFSSPSSAGPSLIESYGHIPLAFTVNEGQTASEVAFTTDGSGCGMFFTPTGTTYVLDGGSSATAAKPGENDKPATGRESFALICRFIGANPSPGIIGEERLSWDSNYFIGSDPTQWRTDVPNYEKIRLHDLYDGIDLVYYGNRSRLKYDFIIASGENPSDIRLQYDFGETGGMLAVNGGGELVVSTPAGDLIERAPYAYQTVDGNEQPVEAEYRIIDADMGQYGFSVGNYDPAYELVIDPELVYSTYLGSNKTADTFIDMAVDSEGYAYIFGEAGPDEFPVTPGAYYTEFNHLFVTKMNRDGSGLVYSTYFPGTFDNNIDNNTSGVGIDVDDSGNVYIAGSTSSTDFPITPGAYQSNLYDNYPDMFVTKLNASGNALIYSTFIGGPQADNAMDFLVDNSGNAYLTGFTSPNFDPFVIKLNQDGSDLIFSTFIAEQSPANAMAVDDSGNIYLAGSSNDMRFHATPGAYDESFNGGDRDVFVLKLSPDGKDILYATFIGGSDNDDMLDIVTDKFGNAYIVGHTASEDFPTTPGSFDESYNGNITDAFIAKINADGSDLIFSTFLGSNGADYIRSLSLDREGNIYIVGDTSSQIGFPITSDIFKGVGFITILDANGSYLKYSTRFGGLAGGGSSPQSIKVDEEGNMYIAGTTVSWEFPVTDNAYDDSIYVYHDPEIPEEYDYAEPKIFVSKFSSPLSTGIETESGNIPTLPVTIMNYPNPFNPMTTITYTLRELSYVRIIIFNVSGQMIAELVNGYVMVGSHNVFWNASDFASGIYIARIVANDHASQCKMILMK